MGEIQFGLMIRGQFPGGEDMCRRFEEILGQARLAHALGFASLTKGSHYASAPLQDLQQIPFLARMAAEAPGCRLNAGIVLLPLHKPLDIAEQIATLDVISGGRAIFGCGLGYREIEFKAFGTTRRDRVARFEENLAAVRRLWTEERVSIKGSHFELEEVTAGLRPVQRPHPPIWLGANGDRAIRRAARLGDCWYIPPHNRVDVIERQLDVYRRELDACGRPFPAELPMRREVFVAATRAEALRLCGPALELKYQTYRGWGQDMPRDDSLGGDLADLTAGRFYIGSPDEVAEDIAGAARRLGVNHMVLSIHWPGMEIAVANDAIRRFAEEVVPRVRQAV